MGNMHAFEGPSEKDKERKLCLVMLITGALQNVKMLRVIRTVPNQDNSGYTLERDAEGGAGRAVWRPVWKTCCSNSSCAEEYIIKTN